MVAARGAARRSRLRKPAIRIGFNVRHLSYPVFRGLHRYTVNLLRELSTRPDIELVLFTTTRELPYEEFLSGLDARVVAVQASREAWWGEWVLPRQLRRERIDVFHAPADRGVPLLSPCPTAVTVHDSYERSHWRTLFPSLKERMHYARWELANRRASAVITVSDTTRRTLVELGVAPDERLHRVYLAASPEFQPKRAPSDAHVLAKYDVRPPYVFYAGGYDSRKNVESLVEAFARSGLENHMLVVAAAQLFRFPQLLADWRQLPGFARMRFVQPLPQELPALYRNAQLFVNPSTWESFSLQLLEAMASGTPVLASNRTAIPEIAGDAAIFFDPADIDGLASLITRAAADDELRATLRARGFSRARKFSWQQTADETLAIYRAIARHASHAG